jgi:ABC-type transport system involved in multi-copper enzyme maturation permease subunit
MNSDKMSFGRSASLMAGLFFRTVVRRKGSWIAGLLALAVVLVFGWAALGAEDSSERLEAYRLFLVIGPLGFLVQFGALLYGLAAVTDDRDGGTAAYIFVRPISRAAVFTGRLFAAALTTAVLVTLIHLVVAALARFPGGVETFLLTQIPILAGALCYTALFMLMAATVRNSMVIGTIWLVIWELVAAQFPWRAKLLTVKYHLLSFVNGVVPGGADVGRSGPAALFEVFEESPGDASIVIGTLTITALTIAWLRYRNLES